MKKICLIATVPMTVRSFLLPIARYYQENTDWDISILCDHDSNLAQEIPAGIHYLPIPMKRGISFQGVHALNRMIALFKREKFDMVQYCTPNASFYASIAAKLAKIPVRLYCQWGMAYVGFHGLKRKIFKAIEKTVCGLSTWVEPDSHGNLEFSHAEGLYPENKGSVVWNGSTGGIDLQQFDIAQKQIWRSEIRTEYGIPEDVFLYGFVGRITRDKGINELLAAFQKVLNAHPSAHLMLVGGIERENLLDKELLCWARNCPNILFTGPQRRIERFYSAFNAFVLPSYREGFGSVIIEAEAMEVPVIATQIPGPTEAMQKDHTGFMVPKQDIDALANAMCRLYENPLLCAQFGKAGRTYVEARFEQQEFYRRTLEDKKKLLSNRTTPKRICFVTTVHGTLRSFVLKLAEYMHENANYDISFICNPNEAFEASLPEYIHFFPIPMERGISLGGIGAMLKMVKLFRREKFDLVQYSTPNAAFYAAIASKLAGIVHRKYHLMGFRYLGFSGFKKDIFKLIEKFTCKLSTSIECVSPSNMALGIDEGILPADRVCVIHHGSSAGIDLTRFDINNRAVWRKELRREYGFCDDDCVFGFAGRITCDKGINELLQAFENMHSAHKKLVLIGSIEQEESLDSELLSQARNSPKVRFIANVTDIERYYTMMDVLVLPSYREGFGNVVIEAQAMGTPVIVSDIPGPIDAMEANVSGLTVPVFDVSALCSAMDTLADSPQLREEYGTNGRKLVEKRFDQELLFPHIISDREFLLSNNEGSI